jgi:plasmid stability protein
MIGSRRIVASITIRNLDEHLKSRLRVRAARRGHSMEEEAREILRAALASDRRERRDLYAAIRQMFEPVGGVELEPMPREGVREPPEFDR